MDDRDECRHRQLPDGPANRLPEPSQQTTDYLARTREPKDLCARGARLGCRQRYRNREHADADREESPASSR
jgi:hypothetical protein